MTCDVHGVVAMMVLVFGGLVALFLSKMMRVWPAPAPSGFVCGVTVAARGAFPTGPEWSGFCPLCRKAPKTCCELKSIYYILLVANHYLWHKTDTFSDKKHFLAIFPHHHHTKLSTKIIVQKCYWVATLYTLWDTTDSYLLQNCF